MGLPVSFLAYALWRTFVQVDKRRILLRCVDTDHLYSVSVLQSLAAKYAHPSQR